MMALSLGAPSQGHQLGVISGNGNKRKPIIKLSRIMARSELRTLYEEGNLEHPKWSGNSLLSRLVGGIISVKPFFAILKLAARQLMISKAAGNNIPWQKMRSEILECEEVYKELEKVRNPCIIYPDYYLKPFHAYDEGHLSWLAATEVEAATMSMVMRAVPNASCLDEAKEVVFGNWLQRIDEHHMKYSSNNPILDILDIGCSIGLSTTYLADKFPSAKTIGLDLSPYFLAGAEHNENKRAHPRKNPIRWLHENGEHTSFPSRSFYLLSIAHLATSSSSFKIILCNPIMSRILLIDKDNKYDVVHTFRHKLSFTNPKSKITQELSPIIYTLLKSVEPYVDEYHLTDVEGRMREVGFVNVKSRLTDPRHVTVTATVPL
ncbi:uncharacterized protein LOC120088975 [Benincasa hispida]|uniref:uncharacterized protein LOC120088975 n=1 Tax=Benincasa hispida TaxID=102211 RepID=UPI0018FFD038|nr:uncharacterized protein LOC120088975 [Benincasa hispida]